MAVSVDTVYQRVLAITYKEQRGYITPQEYNLLANQAQMDIFESYFYSKNQRERTEADRTNEIDETDMSELLDRKLAPFSSFETVTSGHTYPTTVTANGATHDVFQLGHVMLGDEPCQKVSMFEAQRVLKSQRHMATTSSQAPFYTDNRVTGRDIVVYAGSTQEETTNVTVECFRVPATVNWAYVVVNNKALYNSTLAVDFELHRSEEDTLVNKVLELAGIVINKPGLAALGTQMAANETAAQKL